MSPFGKRKRCAIQEVQRTRAQLLGSNADATQRVVQEVKAQGWATRANQSALACDISCQPASVSFLELHDQLDLARRTSARHHGSQRGNSTSSTTREARGALSFPHAKSPIPKSPIRDIRAHSAARITAHGGWESRQEGYGRSADPYQSQHILTQQGPSQAWQHSPTRAALPQCREGYREGAIAAADDLLRKARAQQVLEAAAARGANCDRSMRLDAADLQLGRYRQSVNLARESRELDTQVHAVRSSPALRFSAQRITFESSCRDGCGQHVTRLFQLDPTHHMFSQSRSLTDF